MKTTDPEEILINELVLRVGEGKNYNDDAGKKKIREEAIKQFPVIRSFDNPHANFEAIRKRMKSAAKVSGVWRGSRGFIEVSIKDMLAHGCTVYGRNFVLPEGGLGVHDVVHPEWGTRDGKIKFTAEEREEHRKNARRIIGCNANGSGTAKALLAATCLRLGIRCILNVGQVLIVDSWPDYGEDSKVLDQNYCGYTVS